MHRTIVLSLMLATFATLASVPPAAANHVCGPTDGGSTTTGTVTTSESGYECHQTYFGTGYYQDYTYGWDDHFVAESTTGALVRVHQGFNDGSGADGSGAWEGGSNDWSVEASMGDTHAYSQVNSGENHNPTWGCEGYTNTNMGAWNNDLGWGGGASASRGDSRTVPCLPVDPHTFL